MALLRSHGITRDNSKMNKLPDGPWYYEQIALGFNYRMTEIQAALGISQMDRLSAFLDRRHQIAERYNNLLADLPVNTPAKDNHYSALHLYVVRLKLDSIVKTQREVFEAMREGGIAVNLHYIPVHTQPYYRAMGFAFGDFPEAELYYREAISLPIYPGLIDADVVKVVDNLNGAISM